MTELEEYAEGFDKPYRKVEVLEMCVENGLNKAESARLLDCSKPTIKDWADRHDIGWGGVECPSCGDVYTSIATHWSAKGNSCEYPEITDTQREVLTGILMGDGTIESRSNRLPCFRLKMVNRDYLEWFDDFMGMLTTGVSLVNTGEEHKKNVLENENRPTSMTEQSVFQDVYLVYSRRLPELCEFESWYSSGKKRFPKDVDLTPNVLRHWFVCDGCINYGNGSPHIQIGSRSQMDEFDNIRSMFEDIGYEIRKSGHDIYLTHEESIDAWEYMGDPPPGFEYKWI